MDRLQFFVPVRIIAEADQPVTEIYDVDDALTFLEAWPVGRKGPIYQTALSCCAAAKHDSVPTEDARKAFASFARITGILANDSFEKVAIDRDGEVLPLPPRH
ncbi:DUF982 domain-containing protein [Mesorhizobium sp. ZC-5]|uniref:DUF982 domain-containing protein n=1 Tax=Mesorhizobium sp. ZC-5 TaxID=2986066 RepID=UPI0021E95699|nr:DUF982 domain-containing protein [Mesorhizobium sp. ZC-5]MCV3239165.1 DUF982 domain-containing protein [Mesorhizobium sp. ZC-5]